jgi:hypothetical protein
MSTDESTEKLTVKRHTNRYLNYNSYHHPSQNISVVNSLIYRAIRICDDEYLEELTFIHKSLRCNGFPNKLLTERTAKMKVRILEGDKRNICSTPPEPRMILPYMGPLTYRLTNYLRKMLDCEFGFLTGRKLRSFLCNHKFKQKSSPVGIYKMLCSCHIPYIGETGRSIKIRFDEHVKDITQKRTTNSALASHIHDNSDHHLSPDSPSLIEMEPRYYHQKFKEGLFIMKSKNPINRDEGTKINPIWSNFLLPIIKIRSNFRTMIVIMNLPFLMRQ